MSGIKNRKLLSYEDSHKIIDGIVYKLCNCHNEIFSDEYNWFPMTTDYFYKANNKTDGYQPCCKKCTSNKSNNNQKNNSKRSTECKRKWYLENKDEFDKYIKKWRNKNVEHRMKYQLEYYYNNRDKVNSYFKNKQKHDINEQEWISCKEYFNNSCAYCGVSEEEAKELYGQYLHKEHVDCNGKNDLSNCIPSCKQCNSYKWTFDINDWYNIENSIYKDERMYKILKWINEDYKNTI